MPRDKQTTVILQLRSAAERCAVLLGNGLLRCPANRTLVTRLRGGDLETAQFFGQLKNQLLQIVAWMIGQHLGAVPQGAQSETFAYFEQYSVECLCGLKSNGPVQNDRSTWRKLQRIMSALWESDSAIGIHAWNSELFDPAQTSDIRRLEITDEDSTILLSAVYSDLIVFSQSDSTAENEDFDSGTSDPPGSAHPLLLGTIHEWLLELQLDVDFEALVVSLQVRAGHERRATGSYFTPDAWSQHSTLTWMMRILVQQKNDCCKYGS